MRISRIKVEGLFHTFHHEIYLKQTENITIIYGPNGFGKTTILRMVDALMHGRYDDMRSFQFDVFLVEFSLGDFIRVVRTAKHDIVDEDGADGEEADIKWEIKIQYRKGSERSHYTPSSVRNYDLSETTISSIARRIPTLSRIGERHWRHVPTAEVLLLEDVFERYGDQLPTEAISPNDEPEGLRALRRSINIRLVRTQRLEIPVHRTGTVRDRAFSLVPVVVQYARELREVIQQALGEFGKRSQLLDRTFPNRVIRQLEGSRAERDETLKGELLRERLSEQEAQMNRYQQAGLLDKQADSSRSLFAPKFSQDATERVLSVFIQDNEQKLNFLEPLAQKVEVLKEIINNHFAYKRIEVNSNDGFYFVSKRRAGEKIKPSDLSSGEQHLLVLTYELLFKTSENMLIIIDEPEISLHVVWQEEFVHNLQKILRLSPIDVLIATHSPQIIADRWDLAQGLTGPDEDDNDPEDDNVQ